MCRRQDADAVPLLSYPANMRGNFLIYIFAGGAINVSLSGPAAVGDVSSY